MPLRALSLLAHAYVAWRIAPALGAGWAEALFLALLVASFLTMPFGLRGRRAAPPRPADRVLAWAGLLSMGLFSSLFALTVVRDSALAAVALFGWLAGQGLPSAALLVASARAVAITAALVTVWGFFSARRTARVVRIDVPVAGLAEALHGFKIVQISDIHVGPTIKRPYLERVVEVVNGLDADMVAITGDLVDGSVAELAEHVAPLATLRSREGSFFVTGNHEYYSGAAAWVGELRRLGITVLMNQHVVVRRGGAALVVGGVTDFSAGHFDPAGASDPGAALAGAPAADLRLLLAHQPRSAEAAEAAGFDVQLSGHTHGGQFWPWNLFVPLQQPFTAGLNRWRTMWVYTSRGTGYWGPPKRLGAPSEITLLRLVAASGSVPAPRLRIGAAVPDATRS
ncbi:MAG: metallophosphoesterase [Pseudomonadota bacterium]|nr:metallophosphoesterase [Pseudomonadota bacterium]